MMADDKDILAFEPPSASRDVAQSEAARHRPDASAPGSLDGALGRSTVDLPREHLKLTRDVNSSSGVNVIPYAWQNLEPEPAMLPVQIQLGKKRFERRNLDKLTQGDVITLDRAAHELVEIVVQSRVIGYGRIVVADGKLAIEVDRVNEQSRRQSA